MEITEVRINPSKGGKVRAFASVVLDDCFVVNDLRVMEGREGQLYLTMPGRRTRGGQFRDIAHPLDTDTRRHLEERVLEEYGRMVDSHAVPDPAEESPGPLSRLASRLFDERFWTAERADDDD